MEQPLELTAYTTILVVDDNPDVLKFMCAALKNRNFTIITADSGPDALQKARNYKGEIHLLLSDFDMPGMSGIELAAALTADRPTISVLLMSGFTGGMLVLNEGWHFLPKPFIASKLISIITTLTSPERASKFVEYPDTAQPKAEGLVVVMPKGAPK